MSSTQTLIQYRTMRAVEKQLYQMQGEAGIKPRPRPARVRFFDRLLGTR